MVEDVQKTEISVVQNNESVQEQVTYVEDIVVKMLPKDGEAIRDIILHTMVSTWLRYYGEGLAYFQKSQLPTTGWMS